MWKNQEINRNLDVKIMEFLVYVLLGTSKAIAVFFFLFWGVGKGGGKGLCLKKN